MPAAQFGRTLAGISVNLIVRDVASSLPFYTDVLGLKSLYDDLISPPSKGREAGT